MGNDEIPICSSVEGPRISFSMIKTAEREVVSPIIDFVPRGASSAPPGEWINRWHNVIGSRERNVYGRIL